MLTGELKFFDCTKRFGFIAPADGSEDIFLHASAIIDAGITFLREGDPISYNLATSERTGRLCACDVSLPATNRPPEETE